MGSCSVWTLWLRPAADHGSHHRFMSTNATRWRFDESTQGWWWCSHLAENYGGNSTRQIIISALRVLYLNKENMERKHWNLTMRSWRFLLIVILFYFINQIPSIKITSVQTQWQMTSMPKCQHMVTKNCLLHPYQTAAFFSEGGQCNCISVNPALELQTR